MTLLYETFNKFVDYSTTYSVDRQWCLGPSIPFFVLVDPYPFNAIKMVWIDKDVIDSPNCTYLFIKSLCIVWKIKKVRGKLCKITALFIEDWKFKSSNYSTKYVHTLDYQISVAYRIIVAGLDRKIVQHSHSLGKKSDLGISIAQQLFQSIYLNVMYCKKK